jgi:hypothetical protein
MKWTIKAMLETTNQLFNSIITSSFGDFSSVWWMNHDESHTGWWYTYPEKYEFVRLDHHIHHPNYWRKCFSHVPSHQPEKIALLYPGGKKQQINRFASQVQDPGPDPRVQPSIYKRC